MSVELLSFLILFEIWQPYDTFSGYQVCGRKKEDVLRQEHMAYHTLLSCIDVYILAFVHMN